MTTSVGRPNANWRAIHWESQLETESIEGSELSYVDLGSGEPAVLFIHGLGAQWRVWLANLAVIAGHRRVIAPDLPGFGLSSPTDEPVSVEGLARVLDELCERLGLDRVVVVGNSLGGLLAAELALNHPDRIDRLVLVDGAGILPTRGESIRTVGVIWGGIALSRSVQTARRQIASRAWLRKTVLGSIVHDASRVPADLAYEALLTQPGPGTREALRVGLAHLSSEHEGRLATLSCPTLAIWGEEDELVPIRHARKLTRLIRGSKLVTFPETGHVPMIERPRLFNETLLEFIGATDSEGEA